MTPGPSPRVWGELGLLEGPTTVTRTIPTRVGRTRCACSCRSGSPDHPHACGENRICGYVEALAAGPSPRVWGELAAGRAQPPPWRTIPTRVGRTPCRRRYFSSCPDHPHACGENLQPLNHSKILSGPSPRVWGELGVSLPAIRNHRTIPTRVGRTRVRRASRVKRTDHPHACGENHPAPPQ